VKVMSRLLDRIKRLEQRPELAKPAVFRYGWLEPLPSDYAGERHVVIVKREQNRVAKLRVVRIRGTAWTGAAGVVFFVVMVERVVRGGLLNVSC
jgi:hypothetical protein